MLKTASGDPKYTPEHAMRATGAYMKILASLIKWYPDLYHPLKDGAVYNYRSTMAYLGAVKSALRAIKAKPTAAWGDPFRTDYGATYDALVEAMAAGGAALMGLKRIGETAPGGVADGTRIVKVLEKGVALALTVEGADSGKIHAWWAEWSRDA